MPRSQTAPRTGRAQKRQPKPPETCKSTRKSLKSTLRRLFRSRGSVARGSAARKGPSTKGRSCPVASAGPPVQGRQRFRSRCRWARASFQAISGPKPPFRPVNQVQNHAKATQKGHERPFFGPKRRSLQELFLRKEASFGRLVVGRQAQASNLI